MRIILKYYIIEWMYKCLHIGEAVIERGCYLNITLLSTTLYHYDYILLQHIIVLERLVSGSK